MRDIPTDISVKPEVTAFFDEPSNTISYVVKDKDFSRRRTKNIDISKR